MTVSIGVATFSSDFTKHEEWIEAADTALYHAKETGRNKVASYNSDMKE